jgi:hypothetical protein
MLVRALGYTGLQFPHGYLSRANESRVRLIGPYVDTPGFGFTNGSNLGQIVTRNDMAMLLYNFLISNFHTPVNVWNGVTGRYEPQNRILPVLHNFGITPIVGYIVGVENYAMNLNVVDYERTHGVGSDAAPLGLMIGEDPISFTGTPQPIGSNLVQIAYSLQPPSPGGTVWSVDPVTGSLMSSFSPAGAADAYMSSTMANLGLVTPPEIAAAHPEMSHRYWLGIKVLVYARSATARRDIVLPEAVVIGTRTLTDNADHRVTNAAWHGDRDRLTNIDTLTIDFGTGTVYNQAKSLSLRARGLAPNFNLYSWTRLGMLIPNRSIAGDNIMGGDAAHSVVTGTENAMIFHRDGGNDMEDQLARMIRGAMDNVNVSAGIPQTGNYQVWRVDNGTTRRDDPDFFYEFVPFQVGVLNPQGGFMVDGGYGDRTRLVGNRGRVIDGDRNDMRLRADLIVRRTDQSRMLGVPRSDNNAYLFTAFGAHQTTITFMAALEAVVTQAAVSGAANMPRVDARLGNTVHFSIPVITEPGFGFTVGNQISTFSRTFTVQDTGNRAVGALNHNSVASFVLTERVALWRDSTGRILLRQRLADPNPAPTTNPTQYAVVISTDPSGTPQQAVTGASSTRPPESTLIGWPSIRRQTAVTVYIHGRGVERIILDNTGTMFDRTDATDLRPGEYLAIRRNPLEDTWSWLPISQRTTSATWPEMQVTGIRASGLASGTPDQLRSTFSGIGAIATTGAIAYELRAGAATPSIIGVRNTEFPIASLSAAATNNTLVLNGSWTGASITSITSPGVQWGDNQSVLITPATRIIVFGSTLGFANATTNNVWTARSFAGNALPGNFWSTGWGTNDPTIVGQATRIVVLTTAATSVADTIFITTALPLGSVAIAPQVGLSGSRAIISDVEGNNVMSLPVGFGSSELGVFHRATAMVAGHGPIAIIGRNIVEGQMILVGDEIPLLGGTERRYTVQNGNGILNLARNDNYANPNAPDVELALTNLLRAVTNASTAHDNDARRSRWNLFGANGHAHTNPRAAGTDLVSQLAIANAITGVTAGRVMWSNAGGLQIAGGVNPVFSLPGGNPNQIPVIEYRRYNDNQHRERMNISSRGLNDAERNSIAGTAEAGTARDRLLADRVYAIIWHNAVNSVETMVFIVDRTGQTPW